MDNILGTLLGITGKTQDNHKARKDLQKMRLREKLHLFTGNSGKIYLPVACHTMSNVKKTNFLKVIRDVRVPYGHALNVSQFVRIEERTIVGLKSHGSHILMQQIMHIVLHRSLPNKVVWPLIELSLFFQGICSKTLSELDLSHLQSDIIIILCKL
jgi:hypothetical protein